MIFYDFVILSGFPIGVILSAIHYKVLPLDLKIIAWLFWSTFILTILAFYRMLVHHQNNLLFFHVMTLIEFILLSLYLRYNIRFEKIKKFILIAILFTVLFEVIMVFTVQRLEQSPSWLRILTRLFLLYWILFYLRTLLIDENPQPLLKMPAFFVCIGILVYFTSFLQVGLMKYLILENRPLALSWYHFSIWFELSFRLICTYALWLGISQIKNDK